MVLYQMTCASCNGELGLVFIPPADEQVVGRVVSLCRDCYEDSEVDVPVAHTFS